jgi:hypothetical protein
MQRLQMRNKAVDHQLMAFVKAVPGGVDRKDILVLRWIVGLYCFKASVLQVLLKKQARCTGIAGLIGHGADNQIGVIGCKPYAYRRLILNTVAHQRKVAAGLILMVLNELQPLQVFWRLGAPGLVKLGRIGKEHSFHLCDLARRALGLSQCARADRQLDIFVHNVNHAVL